MEKKQRKKREYQCPECDKVLTTSEGLTIHRRLHTGEKPYSCDICGHAFSRKWNYTCHLKSCLKKKTTQHNQPTVLQGKIDNVDFTSKPSGSYNPPEKTNDIPVHEKTNLVTEAPKNFDTLKLPIHIADQCVRPEFHLEERRDTAKSPVAPPNPLLNIEKPVTAEIKAVELDKIPEQSPSFSKHSIQVEQPQFIQNGYTNKPDPYEFEFVTKQFDVAQGNVPAENINHIKPPTVNSINTNVPLTTNKPQSTQVLNLGEAELVKDSVNSGIEHIAPDVKLINLQNIGKGILNYSFPGVGHHFTKPPVVVKHPCGNISLANFHADALKILQFRGAFNLQNPNENPLSKLIVINKPSHNTAYELNVGHFSPKPDNWIPSDSLGDVPPPLQSVDSGFDEVDGDLPVIKSDKDEIKSSEKSAQTVLNLNQVIGAQSVNLDYAPKQSSSGNANNLLDPKFGCMTLRNRENKSFRKLKKIRKEILKQNIFEEFEDIPSDSDKVDKKEVESDIIHIKELVEERRQKKKADNCVKSKSEERDSESEACKKLKQKEVVYRKRKILPKQHTVSGFECKICGKHLTTPYGLTNHLMVHEGQKPFVCRICNHAFTKQWNLKTHIENRHKVKVSKEDLQPRSPYKWNGIISTKRKYTKHPKSDENDITKSVCLNFTDSSVESESNASASITPNVERPETDEHGCDYKGLEFCVEALDFDKLISPKRNCGSSVSVSSSIEEELNQSFEDLKDINALDYDENIFNLDEEDLIEIQNLQGDVDIESVVQNSSAEEQHNSSELHMVTDQSKHTNRMAKNVDNLSNGEIEKVKKGSHSEDGVRKGNSFHVKKIDENGIDCIEKSDSVISEKKEVNLADVTGEKSKDDAKNIFESSDRKCLSTNLKSKEICDNILSSPSAFDLQKKTQSDECTVSDASFVLNSCLKRDAETMQKENANTNVQMTSETLNSDAVAMQTNDCASENLKDKLKEPLVSAQLDEMNSNHVEAVKQNVNLLSMQGSSISSTISQSPNPHFSFPRSLPEYHHSAEHLKVMAMFGGTPPPGIIPVSNAHNGALKDNSVPYGMPGQMEGQQSYHGHIMVQQAMGHPVAGIIGHNALYPNGLPCKECGRVFVSKETLDFHMKEHKGNKTCQCPICDKTFSNKSNLTRHMLIHAKQNTGSEHSVSSVVPSQPTSDPLLSTNAVPVNETAPSVHAQEALPSMQSFPSNPESFLSNNDQSQLDIDAAHTPLSSMLPDLKQKENECDREDETKTLVSSFAGNQQLAQTASYYSQYGSGYHESFPNPKNPMQENPYSLDYDQQVQGSGAQVQHLMHTPQVEASGNQLYRNMSQAGVLGNPPAYMGNQDILDNASMQHAASNMNQMGLDIQNSGMKQLSKTKEYQGDRKHPTKYCTICNKAFSASYYPNHMKMHAGTSPHICTICNQVFSQKFSLTRHMENIHNKSKVEIPGMEKMFKLGTPNSSLTMQDYPVPLHQTINPLAEVANEQNSAVTDDNRLICDKVNELNQPTDTSNVGHIDNSTPEAQPSTPSSTSSISVENYQRSVSFNEANPSHLPSQQSLGQTYYGQQQVTPSQGPLATPSEAQDQPGKPTNISETQPHDVNTLQFPSQCQILHHPPLVSHQMSVEESEPRDLSEPKSTEKEKNTHLCTVCNKSYSSAATLKAHHRIHTGEKPFVCPHCHKAFTFKGNMKQHVSKHHGDAPPPVPGMLPKPHGDAPLPVMASPVPGMLPKPHSDGPTLQVPGMMSKPHEDAISSLSSTSMQADIKTEGGSNSVNIAGVKTEVGDMPKNQEYKGYSNHDVFNGFYNREEQEKFASLYPGGYIYQNQSPGLGTGQRPQLYPTPPPQSYISPVKSLTPVHSLPSAEIKTEPYSSYPDTPNQYGSLPSFSDVAKGAVHADSEHKAEEDPICDLGNSSSSDVLPVQIANAVLSMQQENEMKRQNSLHEIDPPQQYPGFVAVENEQIAQDVQRFQQHYQAIQSRKRYPSKQFSINPGVTHDSSLSVLDNKSPQKSSESLQQAPQPSPKAKQAVCPICNKELAYSSSLTSHMRTHTGEKPFQCELCDKSFAQKSNLNTHMKSHLKKMEGRTESRASSVHSEMSNDSHYQVDTGFHPGSRPISRSQSMSSDIAPGNYDLPPEYVHHHIDGSGVYAARPTHPIIYGEQHSHPAEIYRSQSADQRYEYPYSVPQQKAFVENFQVQQNLEGYQREYLGSPNKLRPSSVETPVTSTSSGNSLPNFSSAFSKFGDASSHGLNLPFSSSQSTNILSSPPAYEPVKDLAQSPMSTLQTSESRSFIHNYEVNHDSIISLYPNMASNLPTDMQALAPEMMSQLKGKVETPKKPPVKKLSEEEKLAARTCTVCNKVLSCTAGLRHHMRMHTGCKPFRCKLCNKRFSQKCNTHTHIKSCIKHYIATGEFSKEQLEKNEHEIYTMLTACDEEDTETSLEVVEQTRLLAIGTPLDSDSNTQSGDTEGKDYLSSEDGAVEAKVEQDIISSNDSLEQSGRPNSEMVRQKLLDVMKEIPLPVDTDAYSSEEPRSESQSPARHLVDPLDNSLSVSNEIVRLKREKDGKKNYSSGYKKRKCTECGIEITGSPSSMVHHMRVHTKEKPFICDYCSRPFSMKFSLNRHIQSQHGENRHERKGAKRKINVSDSDSGSSVGDTKQARLEKEKSLENEYMAIQSEMPNDTFKNEGILDNPIGNPLGRLSEDYELGSVNYVSGVKNSDGVMSHLSETKHRVEGSGHVGKVEKSDPSLFKGHVNEKKGLWKCQICGKEFESPVLLQNHLTSHTGCFNCALCDKTFRNKNALKRHFEKHKTELFQCNVCEEFYATETELVQHSVIHSWEKCPDISSL